jgi:hypothetical protein
MALSILENGKKIKFQELASIHGWTEESMKESGKATIWRATGTMCGTMAENMRACIKMIRSMDSVSTPGQMADATKATGGRANSTD